MGQSATYEVQQKRRYSSPRRRQQEPHPVCAAGALPESELDSGYEVRSADCYCHRPCAAPRSCRRPGHPYRGRRHPVRHTVSIAQGHRGGPSRRGSARLATWLHESRSGNQSDFFGRNRAALWPLASPACARRRSKPHDVGLRDQLLSRSRPSPYAAGSDR
jgi:hypothetical protein